ncbi:hypothetical protein [Mesorhizobium sp. ANAO-SY3R2]|uniref:hypothetical protein n=1 Tax=Mesorhizobium sp. ANAO-SY3R2 TaxID=3166644 RepID=UPI0036708703
MTEAALLRLEAEFNAASDIWDQATGKTARASDLVDRTKARLRKAEADEEQAATSVSLLFHRIINTRATTLSGLLAKVRVRDCWNADDERSEIATLQSLVADLKAIAEEQS